MSALTTVFSQGLAASRPAAASSNNGWFYLATDTNGGTLYQSNGSSWVQCGAGVSGSATATFSGARVFNSANQSLTNNTLTALAFDSESFDTDAYHSTVTNTSRLTVPTGKGGYFLISASVEWPSNTTGARQLFIRVNGTSYIGGVAINSPPTGSSIQTVGLIYNLADADYVEAVAAQGSGGALNASFDSGIAPLFSLARLGS